MNITSTAFDSTYHSAQSAGNQTHGYYVFHNIDVWNEIDIDGQRYTAVYQAGMDYLYNDYQCPNPKLGVSEAGGSHPLIVLVDSLWAGTFDDESETQEALEHAQQFCTSIKTADDLFQLYQFIRDETPNILDFVEFDDLSDYEEEPDERTGYLILKECNQ